MPDDPARLADELENVTRALRASIDAWVEGVGARRGGPPLAVVLQALYQQRLYRVLAGSTDVSQAVMARLPSWLVPEARANAMAGAKLLSLIQPVSRPRVLRTRRPRPAGVLLDHYREAERRFRIDWEVLAAINFIESKFGRVRSASSAGAQGPMQFAPSTWAAYGMGGDVHDDRDAILGAANYLRASGAPSDYGRALYAYNHSDRYVEAVLAYARQMRGDPRDFYGYYNWQVFVLTPSGARRLTGPGV